jgi:hypothetical protein
MGIGIGVISGLLVGCLSGCGTTTDRQTKTVEQEQYQTGPIVVDSPIGRLTVQPATIVRQRTETEVERERTVIDAPEAATVIGALAGGGTPWGLLATGLVGALSTGYAMYRSQSAYRMLKETVEGVEEAKAELPPDNWKILKGKLAASQSRDTRNKIDGMTP